MLTLDEADAYALAVDTRTALLVDREQDRGPPVVDGDAVEVVPVRFESDPGYDEYEVITRHAGTATVTLTSPDAAATFSFIVS